VLQVAVTVVRAFAIDKHAPARQTQAPDPQLATAPRADPRCGRRRLKRDRFCRLLTHYAESRPGLDCGRIGSLPYQLVQDLQHQLGLRRAVETGTYLGGTTR